MKIIKTISVLLFILILSSSYPLHACTGIYGSDSDNVLVGNNEDWNNPCTKIWFLPAEKGIYGRVCVGYCDMLPQGGMNEKGLYADCFATAPVKVVKSKNKKQPEQRLVEMVIEKCATVDEALKLLDQYDLSGMEKWNMFISDAKGNSAILEGDDVVRKRGQFQVCTNFHQSKMTAEEAKCSRYKIAWQMLNNKKSISVAKFRDILDATHAEGLYSTQYSNVCDLKNRKLYLYHFHNFDDVREFDLMDMLKTAPSSYDMPDLFDNNPEFKKYKDDLSGGIEQKIEQRQMKNPDRSRWSDFAGKYKIMDDAPPIAEYLYVELKDDKLISYSLEDQKIELIPETENRFFYLNTGFELTIEFVRDDEGEVTSLYAYTKGEKVECRKVE
jgi:penicillin V acylase-like amidase (Ntn superfamily)